MRRFTGWVALIILLCGLGYFMYEDMRQRRIEDAGPAAVTADTPEIGGIVSRAPSPPTDASVVPRPASEDTAAAVVDAPAPTEQAIASADTTGPAVASPAGSPASADAAPVAPASEPTAPEVPAAAAPEDAADAAVAPSPEASPGEDTPAVAEDPAATSAAEETQVALAPEGVPVPSADGAPPVSESSDRKQPLRADADAPEATADTPAETVIAAVDPGADVEAKPPAAEPQPLSPGLDSETADSAVVPTFDVVRVESTGDAVIAGSAAPGDKVEILSGTATVATATAAGSGDWAIALDTPLPAGQHDLAIRATAPDGEATESEQRVLVLVPESSAEEPLVVLNTPDAPSTVLQVPAAPEPPAPVAAGPDGARWADVVPAPAATAGLDVAGAPAPAADIVSARWADVVPAPAGPVEPSGTLVADAPQAARWADIVASPAASAAMGETGEDEVPAIADAGGTAARWADVVSGPEAGPDESAPVAGTSPGDGKSPAEEVAVAQPEPAAVPEPEPLSPPEPEPVAPVVVVTAVEAETSGALFVAGTATTPEDVRIYMDDVLLGEATPSPSGTWLLEVQRELPAGTYDVRADQVEGGTGTVLARAAVPFERDIDVAILTPVAEAGGPSGATATGQIAGPTTVIIKRSDNLWRISRELYGKGIRWSTIYQANKDQIRNPRWIYPGQVFVLPAGSVEWSGEDAPTPN